MIRLRGHAAAPGLAIGSAVVLSGRDDLPEPPPHVQYTSLTRQEVRERAEVIVVAERLADAIAFRAPWARVVGIATADDEPGPHALVPVVAAVNGLLEAVAQHDLLLVDGELGTILVDPSSFALAEYQAEREQSASRGRVYLEFEHQPARTIDGREVRVVARVRRDADVVRAMEAGADALLLADGFPFPTRGTSDAEQLRGLSTVIDAAPGKPLTVWDARGDVSLAVLLRAAIRADITLALPLVGGLGTLEDLEQAIQDAREELTAAQAPFTSIHVAAIIGPGDPVPTMDWGPLVHRVLVVDPVDCRSQAATAWLDELVAKANAYALPVAVALPRAAAYATRACLGLGVSGFIAAPAAVAATKARVYRLSASECRAALAEAG
jgi:phosphoenolpyruvate-protein kinase (PTS system EI component)